MGGATLGAVADSMLPAPLAPALLPRLIRRVARGAMPEALRARGLIDAARRAGLEPIGVAVAPTSSRLPPGAPTAALVHAPGPPEQRAALMTDLGRRADSLCLALTPAEWALLSCTADGARLAGSGSAWGELAPPPLQDEPALRRRALRAIASLHLGAYAQALSDRRWPDAARCAAWLRDELELAGSPSRFPPRAADDAPPIEHEAATLGALHAVFAAEVAVDDGEGLVGDAPPQRTTSEADELAAIVLADLPGHAAAALRALYLLPGPFGSRRAWQLTAIVADEAPLVEACRSRARLAQHLAMVPDTLRRAVLGDDGPVVLTEAAAAGLVRRRLTAEPLRRLTARLHRRLLLGDDVLEAALLGPDLVPADLAAELAALLVATAACWRRDASEAATRDLAFGSWPAALHLLRGGSPLDSLRDAHAALAAGVDPAVSALARRGQRPAALAPAGRGRPTALLRDRGPALIRIQEVAVETLNALQDPSARTSA